MEDELAPSRVTMHVMGSCLVVPIQVELTDRLMMQIQKDIVDNIASTGAKGVIVDVSGVNILDSFLGQKICDTAKMASLLGAPTVVTGMRPAIAASLVDLGFQLRGVETALNVEEGYRKLERMLSPEVEEPEEEEPGEQGLERGEEGADETEEGYDEREQRGNDNPDL
jgi:rsbT antagonist protein RsbS